MAISLVIPLELYHVLLRKHSVIYFPLALLVKLHILNNDFEIFS